MHTYFLGREISRILLIAIVAVLPFMGGCGEDHNPITDDHDEEEIMHADADGFVLKVDGNQVYRQFEGEHKGELTVTVGEEIEVQVSFLDDHEHEFHPGEEEDEDDDHDHENEETELVYAIGLSEYDDTIIEIHLDHDDEDHDDEDHDDEDAGLSFGVEGISAGNTEIKLQLLHGDHPDYTAALLIPVTVE